MRTDTSRASEHGSDATPDPGPSPGSPAIEVKAESVKVLLRAAGWSPADLARRAKLDQSAVGRLLRRDLRPGPRSMAGVLSAFAKRFPEIGFYDLFEVFDENGEPVSPPVGSVAVVQRIGIEHEAEERSA